MTFHIYKDLGTTDIGISYIFQSQTVVSKFVTYAHTNTNIHTYTHAYTHTHIPTHMCASIFTHILDSKVGQYDRSFQIHSTQESSNHDRQCRDNHYNTKHTNTQNRLKF